MLVRDQWSRRWAHWDGATASIEQTFTLRFIGVKKTKRNDVVVVRVSHTHQPGQPERLELQLSGCELIAHHKPRAGELNGLSSLRHAQRAPEGSLFQVVVSVDDLKLLEAIGVPEPPLWSGSMTGQTAYVTRDVQEGKWKFKVNVGELFERKVGGTDTQFAYITPTDVEATEYNAKVPPEDWVDFEDTLQLKFSSAAAAVDQAAAIEAAASSSGAETSCSVGWSCDRVAEVIDEVVRHTPLTNGKEPERPHLGRQASMRDQAAAAGRRAAPEEEAVPRSPHPASLPVPSVPYSAAAPAPDPTPPMAPAPAASAQAPASAMPVFFNDAALPLVSKFFGGLTVDEAQSVSWLDDVIKSLLGANEVVPSDAVTPADSYVARLEFIEEKISSILAECLKKSGVEHSVPAVRAPGTQPVFAAVRSLKRALRCAASSAPAPAHAPGEVPAPASAGAPAPASGLSNSIGRSATGHACFAAMHLQHAGGAAAAATAVLPDSEQARLVSERTFVQAAAAEIDREHSVGGGVLSQAVGRFDSVASSLREGAPEAEVAAVGMAFSDLPAQCQRLESAPPLSFSPVSSELLNSVVTKLNTGREALVRNSSAHLVQYLNVDREPQIGEARRVQLESAFLALVRGELTSPALSEQALLKKGGSTMFSSLEAGNESITKDLLEIGRAHV